MNLPIIRSVRPDPILVCRLLLAAGVLLLGWRTLAATQAQTPRTVPSAATPLPDLVQYASAHDLPCRGIELADTVAKPTSGDRTSLLVTLTVDGRARQWIALLELEDAGGGRSLSQQTIYTSTGSELHFTNTEASLGLTFIGPFSAGQKPRTSQYDAQLRDGQRVAVAAEHLTAGLDRYGALALQLAERSAKAGVKHNQLFYIGSEGRMSASDLAMGKRYIEIVNPTPDEERTVFSVAFGLNSLLGAAFETPEFKEVVNEVLIKPSAWSILRNFGASRYLAYDPVNVKVDEALSRDLALPVYRMPVVLHLNGNVALEANIAFTSATPPLEACAGIIAVEARHPSNPNRTLRIELLASRRAGADRSGSTPPAAP